MTDGNSKRGRGILTPADRRYLLGEEELTEGSEYNTRRRIRERLYNAILDFEIIFNHLSDEDREQVFQTEGRGSKMGEDDALHRGLVGVLALILQEGHVATHISPYSTALGAPAQILFEEAIRMVAAEEGYLVKHIDLLNEIISAERIPWPNIENDLEDGKDLPNETIRFLLEHEEVDERQVQEQIREMIFGEAS